MPTTLVLVVTSAALFLFAGNSLAVAFSPLAVVNGDSSYGDEYFGNAVASNGRVTLVASFRENAIAGSVYVLDPLGGDRLAKIRLPNGQSGDAFGHDLAVSGELAIIGASGIDDAAADAGAAFIYDLTTLEQRHKLLANDAGDGDRFGWAVDIDEHSAIVGARYDDDRGHLSGSAYIYDVQSGQQRQKLLPPLEDATGHWFGASVAISGNRAIVGAPLNDEGGSQTGAAYVFDVATGDLLMKLSPGDLPQGQRFGSAVDVLGNIAIVSGPGDYSGTPTSAAYLFDLESGQHFATLVGPEGVREFGRSVALSEEFITIGGWTTPDVSRLGAVYLFDATTLQMRTVLTGESVGTDGFGFSVSLDGRLMTVGAPTDAGGKAYIYLVPEPASAIQGMVALLATATVGGSRRCRRRRIYAASPRCSTKPTCS